MTLTLWFNDFTSQRLTRTELAELQNSAARLYQANPQLFEDERDALSALGAIPLRAHLEMVE